MRSLILAAAFIAVIASDPAWAGGTTIWEVATQDDFNGGDLKGVTVFAPGGIRPGPKLARVELDEGAVWSLARTPKGVVYAGTARPAVVYRLRGLKPEKVLDAETLMISCMTAAPDGTVFAAASPGGRLYRIPPEGEPSLVRIPADYIWDITLDARGDLLAATGPKGILFRVDGGGGWVKEVFRSDLEKNLISVAVAPDGNIYCGSAENGILYRIGPSGEVGAVHDFKEKEVRCLVPTASGLTVGTNVPKKGFDQVSFAANLSGTLSSESWGSGSRREDVLRKIAGAAIYVVDGEGRVEERDRLDKTFLLGLTVSRTDRVFAATGDSGRVFSLDPQGDRTTEIDIDEDQVLCMVGAGGFPAVLGTGSPGALYVVEAPLAAGGTYLSAVHDTGFTARFGRADWTGRGAFEVSFRSGCTEKPDRTWSDWCPPVQTGDVIPCPPGRHLQFRVRFPSDEQARLSRIQVAYAVQNQRPEIKEFKVSVVPEKPVRPAFRNEPAATVKISVKAEDPNGDTLAYRFFCRREGSNDWVPLHRDGLEKKDFDWDTTTVTDGIYRVKAVVSDAPSSSAPSSRKSCRGRSPLTITSP